MTAPNLNELRQMSTSDRLRLMEDLWASLAERPEMLEPPQWHREELDARLKSHRADPSAVLGWSEVQAEFTRAPRK
jgi:putative addiction module component (TIGR02574 family)